MIWKCCLGLLFVFFTALTIVYSNKNLLVYNKEVEVVVVEDHRNEKGVGTTYSTPQKIIGTYQENYGSIGGAIGFSIMASASLIGLVLLIRKEKETLN
jgi:hypothetical protein